MSVSLITKYFPDLSATQVAQFEQIFDLYSDWNERINVVSRKDIEHLYLHHVLHSLAIAKVVAFKPSTRVVDLGTGGGFPGIPLAIMFPETQFLLTDSIGKKIKVVQEVADALKLENVEARHIRTEEVKIKADFVVSRAVATIDKLAQWSRNLIAKKQINALPNGLICLKGSNMKTEMALLGKEKKYIDEYAISKFFEEEYFAEKSIIYFPI